MSEDNAMTATETVADNLGIKVSKPKAMPETDENNIIGSSETQKTGGVKQGRLRADESGILVSKTKQNKVNEVPSPQKVAVYSTRNVYLDSLGKINKGYNIISEELAEKWLERDHVRIATPEEIAQEFGK
jgi:hypothetical protein